MERKDFLEQVDNLLKRLKEMGIKPDGYRIRSPWERQPLPEEERWRE
jgi:hypothetical protein